VILKSLELMGFKSFPDKTLLTFGSGITAVLGPNGSGKSNISDAVRWVLGEQSTKQLRGSKMEDVIFNGTASRRSLGYAEVTLGIDNTDRSLGCDSDEVFITRRYYRSGESEYKINGAAVRLRDINELFMDTGLGRDGYSMISQGKIGDIVGAKSDERRDIFEEAAGISRYRYRKVEAERKLERTEENLLRLRDIMAELTSRVGPLEEQSRKARAFLEYSEEKKSLEIGLWLDLLSKSKDALREQEHKIASAEAQYDELCRSIAETELLIEAKNAEGASNLVQIEELRAKAHSLEEEAARKDGEAAVEENNIAHNREAIERIRGEINDSEGSDSGILEDIAFRKGQIEEKKHQIDVMRSELEQSTISLEKLLSDSGEKNSESERLNREISELSEKLSLLQVRLASSDSSRSEILLHAESALASAAEKDQTVAALEEELRELSSDLEAAEESLTSCTNSREGFAMKLEAAREKADRLKNEQQAASVEALSREKRAAMLAELERNMDGFAHSVKVIMKEKEAGRLGGIHGPVSRLVTADAKYAVAIETALGSASQNIVVSNEEDAKRAIRFLKSSDNGRGTFLPLSSVRPQSLTEKGLEDCAGFVGVADSLVNCDKKYSGVIASLLGRTAVCEDLDSAVSIARKYSYRFRIVTLDGQVVNTGGSLTGGSLAKNAGLLTRQGKIEEAKKQAAEYAAKAEKVGEELKSALAALSEAQASFTALTDEMTAAAEDRIRVLGEVKRVNEALEGVRLAKQELLDEAEAAKQRAENLSADAEKAKTEAQELTLLAEKRKQELALALGEQDELSLARERLTEKNAGVRMDILAVEKEIAALNDAVSLLDSQRADVSGRIELLGRQISQYEAAIVLIEGKVQMLREQSAELRREGAEAVAQADSLAAKRLSGEAEITALRAKDKEESSRRELLGNEAARLAERRNGMLKEIDDAVAKLYDEYQLTRSEAEEVGVIPEDVPAANKRLAELKSKIRSLGTVNVGAIEEFEEVSARYTFMKDQLEDVELSKKELEKLISELTGYMQEVFTEKFARINEAFSVTFTDLFGGGTAGLSLSDPNDILQSGINITVQPPGKKISSIEQLSGGEKALIAIAVYFAIMRVSPPPFCMLDEVEAALDDVNVGRFAQYMRRMTAETQFIAITHRRGTMEEADVLYGVTMQEKGVSKLLKLDVAQIEKELQLAK